MVERISETDDALTEKFLGGEEISTDELKKALRKAVIEREIVPGLLRNGSSQQRRPAGAGRSG